MSNKPDQSPAGRHLSTPKLKQSEINQIAVDQKIRSQRDTDEHGMLKDGIEHSTDVAIVAGKMAILETEIIVQPQFGDDDTEVFRRAHLNGGVYEYDD